MAQGQRAARVLLDHQDRHARGVHLEDLLEDGVDERGGEPGGRLVQQQDLGARHERAAHGDHLALASRHRSRRLAPALLEARKEAEHSLHALLDGSLAARKRAQLQVLLDGEAREDVVELRHVGDARPRHRMRGEARDLVVVKGDRALPRRTRPKIDFMRVDLPAPFGPTIVTISPS